MAEQSKTRQLASSGGNLSKREELLVLGSITLLALSLRILFLGKESLWLDEAYSWWFAKGDFLRALTSERTNPPVYYVLLHFWIKLFGSSESSLRSLSIIPSVLSVPLSFFFARKLFNERIGFVAAFLMTISPFQIAYAQETRCFAWQMCAVLCSSLAMLEIFEESRKQQGIVKYIFYTTLALYLHFYTVFFVFAQNVFFLVRWTRNKSPQLMLWIKVQATIFLLFLPWLVRMFDAAGGGGQNRRHLLLKLPQAIFSLFFGDTLIPLDERAVVNWQETLLHNWWILALAGLSVFGLVVGYLQKKQKNTEAALEVGLLLGVPIVVSFASSFVVPTFDERYLIASSPLIFILFSAIIVEQFELRESGVFCWKKNLVRLLMLAGVLGLLGLSLYNYYANPRYGKEQWREAVSYIENLATAEDVIVFDPDYLDVPFSYYSAKPFRLIRVTAQMHDQLDLTDFHRDLAQVKSLWFVRSHFRDDLVRDDLSKNFVQTSRQLFIKDKGIEVYKFLAKQ